MPQLNKILMLTGQYTANKFAVSKVEDKSTR